MSTTEYSVSFLSPKLETRLLPVKGGKGIFARAPVSAGEILTIWSGELFNSATLQLLPSSRQQHSIQVAEDFFLVPTRADEPSDFFNHSCAPNAGLDGQIILRALRAIAVEEEVCYDYAMSDSAPYDEFDCHCGAPNCRRRITSQDWRLPELQERYRGWFSPYLQRLILQAQLAPSADGRHNGYGR